jgi:hypothetical protein
MKSQSRPRPFRLTAPEPLESELQEQVCRVLTQLLLPPAFFFSAAIGATKLSPQQAAALSRAGVKRGLPDVLLVHCGLVFGLELKRRGGRLSKTRVGRTRSGAPRVYEGQEDVFPRLKEAGMSISVVRSVEEALAQVATWGIPLRARVAA